MVRRPFSKEFKQEALRLVRERGVSVARATRDVAVGTNQLSLACELVETWGANIGPDGRGRWPTVIAAIRVDDDLSDYIVEAEASTLSAPDSPETKSRLELARALMREGC